MNKNNPPKHPEGYFGWSRLDGQRGMVTLKDALHNLHYRENGENHEHGKGVIVGVVATLMSTGMSFESAAQLVWQLIPNQSHFKRFPESWVDNFIQKIEPSTIPKDYKTKS